MGIVGVLGMLACNSLDAVDAEEALQGAGEVAMCAPEAVQGSELLLRRGGAAAAEAALLAPCVAVTVGGRWVGNRGTEAGYEW